MPAPYVPAPHPVTSDYLIGTHYFPGWKSNAHWGWGKIEPYPERKPLLGWYDEENPEVTDWEIKWALEHGIQYFLYCWYRDGDRMNETMSDAGHKYGHAIHEGLFHARFGHLMKFAIMWETHNAGIATSEADLIDNLVPYWVDTYFSRPNYLVIDKKPLLFLYGIYGLERIAAAFGGVDKLPRIFDRMREAVRRRGFDGLTIPFELRWDHSDSIRNVRNLGVDWLFAYCWHTPQRFPTPEESIAIQMKNLRGWREAGLMPFMNTASVGWDPMPWASDDPKNGNHPNNITRWKFTPQDWERLLRLVREFMDAEPAGSLSSKHLLLDNWNEWGEGHFISPHGKEGFGYLQAVREVFTRRDNTPDYRTPAELGLGPYEAGYTRAKAELAAKKA